MEQLKKEIKLLELVLAARDCCDKITVDLDHERFGRKQSFSETSEIRCS